MQGGMYCRRCGTVFPNIDAAWAHYHPREVPSQAAAIQFRQAVESLVAHLLAPPTRAARSRGMGGGAAVRPPQRQPGACL